MSLTRTRLRVAVRVMGYYNSVSLTGAMPVMAPFRDRSNHQFTAGHDSERGLKPFSLNIPLRRPMPHLPRPELCELPVHWQF